MANIKRKLENLRPGKEYILSVRAKNSDINATSEFSDSIRFTVPQDSTIPGSITGFNLLSSFEKVMFVFDYSDLSDLSGYEYELYDNSAGTGTPITGISGSNIFTISVDNSTDATSKAYWGRVRIVDTTGNKGPWTSLTQTDQDTPLITEQYISSLTASKITAGTIGAHTITLNGINSILRSSNYSAGTAGWKISGNGDAEFATAIIRGTIDIGTSPYKFKVLSDGNVEIGNTGGTRLFIGNDGSINIGTALGNGPFRVSSSGQVTIGTSPNLFKVNVDGSVEIGNTGSTRLFINNDGAINIGTSLGSGQFIVQTNGQVDIGGNDATSFHIDNSGEVWVGATASNKATAPFILKNTGAIDIGGQDASSLHIFSDGNLLAGAPATNIRSAGNTITAVATSSPSAGYVRYTTTTAHGWVVGEVVSIYGTSPTVNNTFAKVNATITHVPSSTQFSIASAATGTYTSGLIARRAAPFSLDTVSVLGSNPGTVRASDVEISGGISGVGIDRNLSNVLRINDSVALGTSKLYFTDSGSSYDLGINFTLSASSGFIARAATTTVLSITATTGIDTGGLPISSLGLVTGGNFYRDGTSTGALTQITTGIAARWSDSSSGKYLYALSASSIRYKYDIKTLDESLSPEKILGIPVVSFKYKNEILLDDDQRIGMDIPGFIAEEVYKYYPIACDLNKDGKPENWNERIIIPPMLQLIKNLYEKISILESKIL